MRSPTSLPHQIHTPDNVLQASLGVTFRPFRVLQRAQLQLRELLL